MGPTAHRQVLGDRLQTQVVSFPNRAANRTFRSFRGLFEDLCGFSEELRVHAKLCNRICNRNRLIDNIVTM
jgi:hypothetical protein